MNPSSLSVTLFENLPYDVYLYVWEKWTRICGETSRKVNRLLCTLHDLSTHHLRIDAATRSAPTLNEVTRYLSKLPNLNSIHLVNSNDIEMGSLLVERAGLTRLVVMNFPGDHGPLAPQALASCVDLRCLALQCVSLGALDSLTALSSLSHITLYLMYRINDIGPLSACKKLVSLSIMMCPGITDFEPLRAMTGLTSFGLVCNRRPFIVSPLEALANHPSLSAATFVMLIGPVDYSLIATCSQLKTLKLYSSVSPLNIGWIGELKALTSLDLRVCVDISLESLTSCWRLRSLDVRGCLLGPERFTCLDACTQLRTLFCDVDIVLRGVRSSRGYEDEESGVIAFCTRTFLSNLND